MKCENQLDYLEQKVSNDIAKLRKQSNSFKKNASQLNLATLVLGGAVTVLLGLSIPASLPSTISLILKNIALICGVLITIFSGIERFSENRSIWVRQRGTVLRLYTLQSEIEFYKAGLDNESPISYEVVKSFFAQYKEIWQHSNEEWQRIRGKATSSIPSTVSNSLPLPNERVIEQEK